MRSGATLMELGVVLGILGITAGMAVPRFVRFRDRIATEAAATSTVALLSSARHASIRRGQVVAVSFDTLTAAVTVFAGVDTLERRSLGVVHGVRLAVSRDSIAYAGNGMGYGAGNTRLILSRGAAAETLTVSRLGRVRH